MDFISHLRNRRTVRQFTGDLVSKSDLEQVISAGLMAPTPNNSLPWKIQVITNQGLLGKMKEAVHQKLDSMFPNLSGDKKAKLEKIKTFSTVFASAPAVLAILAKPYKAQIDDLLNGSITHEQMNALRHFPDMQSVGALVENVLLAASDLGLGGCWVSGALVASEQLDGLLKGGEYKLQTLVALGKPAVKPSPKDQPNLNDFVSWVG